MTSSPMLRRWREKLSGTPRLVLAVVLLAAGTLVALTSTAPPATSPVLIAVRSVPAGGTVTAGDLTVVRQPAADRPEAALTDPAAAVGHRVVAALGRGEVLTATRLAPAGLTAGLAPGRAIATVTVAASRAAVVTVGDTVQLVVTPDATTTDPFGDASAAGSAEPVEVGDPAQVLALWPGAERSEDTATVVVDVDVGSASRLAVVPPEELVGIVVLTA